MTRFILFTLSAMFPFGIGLAALSGTHSPARAQGGTEACPLQIGDAGAIDCSCSAAATTAGAVWGDGVYTADSNICRAARHAGAIGPNGGVLAVRAVAGRASYPATERNGVASSAWGSYDRSIAFDGSGKTADAGLAACPANAVGLAAGTTLPCACSADAAASGAVWGSGPYTGDSAICRAARHAGAIGTNGGEVRVRVTTGESTYAASERNGVPSSAWGGYSTSFAFDR